jgi:hypothetical protein
VPRSGRLEFGLPRPYRRSKLFTRHANHGLVASVWSAPAAPIDFARALTRFFCTRPAPVFQSPPSWSLFSPSTFLHLCPGGLAATSAISSLSVPSVSVPHRIPHSPPFTFLACHIFLLPHHCHASSAPLSYTSACANASISSLNVASASMGSVLMPWSHCPRQRPPPLLIYHPSLSHPPFYFANVITELLSAPWISIVGLWLSQTESKWPARHRPARLLPSFTFSIVIP